MGLDDLRRRAAQLARPADQGGPRATRTARRSNATIGDMVKSDAWQRLSPRSAAGSTCTRTLGDLRRLPRRRADRASARSSSSSASPSSHGAAAGLAVGRRLPAYRVATGILEGSRHASCSRLAAGRRDPPSSPSRWRSRPPTAAQQAEASATFGPASAASHLHVRGATDIAALAPVVLAFLETLPGLRVTFKSWNTNDSTRPPPPPAGRAGPRPTC